MAHSSKERQKKRKQPPNPPNSPPPPQHVGPKLHEATIVAAAWARNQTTQPRQPPKPPTHEQRAKPGQWSSEKWLTPKKTKRKREGNSPQTPPPQSPSLQQTGQGTKANQPFKKLSTLNPISQDMGPQLLGPEVFETASGEEPSSSLGKGSRGEAKSPRQRVEGSRGEAKSPCNPLKTMLRDAIKFAGTQAPSCCTTLPLEGYGEVTCS